MEEDVGRRIRMRYEAKEKETDEQRDAVFMQLPTVEQERDQFRAFFEVTQPSAVHNAVCGVCARECSVWRVCQGMRCDGRGDLVDRLRLSS